MRRRANKYNAKRTKCLHGHSHASKHEARRCDELMMLYRASLIQNLEIQPPKYVFEHNGVLITTYRADARYFEDGKLVVEDAKGRKTRDYLIKRNLMKAFFNTEIREV